MTVQPVSGLDDVRRRAGVYPVRILQGCSDALLLFGAGFYGANDAIHFADAGVTATIVDLDLEKIDAMRAVYPASWRWWASDVFAYVRMAVYNDVRFDVVSADPFTNLMSACHEELPTLLRLARRAVVLGIPHGAELVSVDGWSSRRLERSRLADWLVIERSPEPA